jgi:hypothetical protein
MHAMPPTNHHTDTDQRQLVELVYELLDAHDDTMRLADQATDMLRWQIHLDYLRDLQRVSRETLAHGTRASLS